MRHVLAQQRRSDEAAATGVVPVIILIAGFSIIAIVLVVFLDRSIENKTVNTSRCVEGSANYSSGSSNAACSGNVAEESNNSFTKDSGYISRY